MHALAPRTVRARPLKETFNALLLRRARARPLASSGTRKENTVNTTTTTTTSGFIGAETPQRKMRQAAWRPR